LLGEKRSASIHCRTELLITQEGTHVWVHILQGVLSNPQNNIVTAEQLEMVFIKCN
jgi:hypothetical protein